MYTGRNMHVVGNLTYAQPSISVPIERESSTGQIRRAGFATGPWSNLGTVCQDGTYVAPGGTAPSGC